MAKHAIDKDGSNASPRPSRRPNILCRAAAMVTLGIEASLLAQPAVPAPQAVAEERLHSLASSTWTGVLDAVGARLRLIVNIVRRPDGTHVATLDSPDQGVSGIVVDRVVLAPTRLRLELETLGAVYEAAVDPATGTAVGHWTQRGGGRFSLTLERSGASADASALRRPQEPARPVPYVEEEVGYLNGGVRLAGTLTRPRGDGPFPAVILLTGTGLSDRNQEIAGHRPFLVIADYLTRKGIAVLRADDRGWGAPPAEFMNATIADFGGDAQAGVAFLRTRSEIDPTRIGILGHSEGGIVASLAAVQTPDVAFLVLLAAPGLSGERLLALQTERLLRASGAGDGLIGPTLVIQSNILAALRAGGSDAEIRARAREDLARFASTLSAGQKAALGLSDAAIEAQLAHMLTPWYRSIVSHDPTGTLSRINIPVLALNGSRDLLVPAAENLAAIAGALHVAGNADFQVHEIGGLNHLLQTSSSGLPAEYGMIEETISPIVLRMVAEWILERVRAR